MNRYITYIIAITTFIAYPSAMFSQVNAMVEYHYAL